MEIKPVYVSFKQAKLLKENGIAEVKNISIGIQQWEVVEWLRVDKFIWVTVDNLIDNKFYFSIRNTKTKEYASRNGCIEDGYNSPQEAYVAAFDYVLTNLI